MWETNGDGTEDRIDVPDGFDGLTAFTILVRIEGVAVQTRGMWFTPESVDIAVALLQQAKQRYHDKRAAAGLE